MSDVLFCVFYLSNNGLVYDKDFFSVFERNKCVLAFSVLNLLFEEKCRNSTELRSKTKMGIKHMALTMKFNY